MRRLAGDRGAAGVEFALVLPLVVLLLFGVVEMSFAFHGYQSTKLAMNDGLREGSVARTETYADYKIASAVQRRLRGTGGTEIDRLVVFKATAPGELPPTTCMNGTPSTNCSVYSKAQVTTMAALGCVATNTCPGFTCAQGWCPAARQEGDLLGVWVRVRYKGVTGIVSSSMAVRATFRDVGVLPIEPKVVDA